MLLMKDLMIDTVVINVANAQEYIVDPAKFRMPKECLSLAASVSGFKKFMCNISIKHGYFPRLTAIYRWNKYKKIRTLSLKIEFSVPKIIYDNNIDEVTNKDFDRVVTILLLKLQTMGVVISQEILKESSVTVVHFSKNILLSRKDTVYGIVQKLSKLDAPKTFDINFRHFQNNGHALYFDNGSNQLVFYDKIRDIEKSFRQSVDKEKTSMQKNLFDSLTEINNIELLRIELRITNKAKLNALLEKYGYSINPTFESIFNNVLSKDILIDYWENLVEGRGNFLFRMLPSELEMLIESLEDCEKTPTSIELVGMAYIMYHCREYGTRDLKDSLARIYTDKTLQRFNKHIEQVDKLSSSYTYSSCFKDIQEALDTFEVLRVGDLGFREGTNLY